MRAVALMLLAANLLLFAWTYTRPPAPAAPDAPPLQASPLVLLGEMSAPPPAPLAVPGLERVGEPERSDCQAVGPFADRDAVIDARDRLLAAGIRALPNAEDASQRLGYWVHTPGAESREAAAATIDRLRRAGIRDFYVVVDEEPRNAVSLGVFSEVDTAEQHAERLRALGFDVMVGERRRRMTAWWLAFPSPEAGSPEAAGVNDLVLAGDGTLLVRPRECE